MRHCGGARNQPSPAMDHPRLHFLSGFSRWTCLVYALMVALLPAGASAAERVRVLKSKPTAGWRPLDVTVPANCGAVTVQRHQMRDGWTIC